MNHFFRLMTGAAALLAAAPLAAQELVGEWSTSAGKCSEMRVIYTADGATRTVINADGDWTPVSEGTYEQADGAVTLHTPDGSRTLTIDELSADTLVLINDNPAAVEAGAERSEYVRCNED